MAYGRTVPVGGAHACTGKIGRVARLTSIPRITTIHLMNCYGGKADELTRGAPAGNFSKFREVAGLLRLSSSMPSSTPLAAAVGLGIALGNGPTGVPRPGEMDVEAGVSSRRPSCCC